MPSNENHPAAPVLTVLTDAIATVEIAPGIGGAIASYRWLRDGAPLDWMSPASMSAIAARDAGAMSCFPLVPYSNRIRNSVFTFEGRTVTLPGTPPDPHFEHGHGWRNSWAITGQTANSIALDYRHNADSWPWDYRAEQVISLENGVLTISISVENLSPATMPMGFGLHPYFPATPQSRITTQVEGMWQTDSEVLPTMLGPVPPEADLANGLVTSVTPLDTVFTGWSRTARIDWPEEHRSLTIEAEAPLGFMTLYTPPNEPFFALEPVSNITDAFNRSGDTGQINLPPNGKIAAKVRFSPRLES